MKRSLIHLSVLCGALAASGAALADHNSKNGEGWANMPNDIHNMRIETREADDNEAFRDFVKYGEGSTSESRSQIHRDSSMTSQRGRSAASSRSSGRKSGGKR